MELLSLPPSEVWSKKNGRRTRIWVSIQKLGNFTPKMDGLFHAKPYEQMDDLGGPPLFLETPIWYSMVPVVPHKAVAEVSK